jgi:hypothetical protein
LTEVNAFLNLKLTEELYMRYTQSQPRSSWSHYAKAVAVFTLTTATYLVARTTGWLPGWLGDDKSLEGTDKSSVLTTSSKETSVIIPTLKKEGKGNFQLPSLSSGLVDLQTAELTHLSITEKDSDQLHAPSTQRRLLQQQTQQGLVTVINPIPDQVIQVGQPYSYSLNQVFLGNFTLLSAVETGRASLPSWLSLNYELIGSYPAFSGDNGAAAISGTNFYVEDGWNGLQILDVSHASNPQQLGYYPVGTGHPANDIAVHGNIVYMVDNLGLKILNTSDPSNPQLVSNYSISGGNVYKVLVIETIAYTVSKNGLQIFNISNPIKPYLLGIYPASVGSHGGVAVSGTIVYVTAGLAGLQILNVSNIKQPRLLSTYPMASGISAWGVTVSETIACIWEGGPGFQILNVSNTTSPNLLATYTLSKGPISNIVILDSIMYVAAWQDGLHIFDVSNPLNPQ